MSDNFDFWLYIQVTFTDKQIFTDIIDVNNFIFNSWYMYVIKK